MPIVGDGFAGIRIIDVSDPTTPNEVSHYSPSRYTFNVYVSGNYAYVASSPRGLVMIDVSDPANPQEVSHYSMPDFANSIDVSGNYVYLADGNAGLRIIDVSYPTNPNEVGHIETKDFAFDVQVSGNYAYVADGDSGLRVVDVSDHTNPQEVGHCYTHSLAMGIYVAGNYAYVADGASGLRVIDVSNPENPQEVGYYDTPGHAYDVYVSGNYAYVADYDSGLRVIDVSDPENPQEVGYYDTPGDAHDVYVSGNYAYVADGNSGVRVINVSDPANPYGVSCYYDTYAEGVYVSDNYVYVADGMYGVRVIDISDPESPREVANYRTPDEAKNVVERDNYIYVADKYAGVQIYTIQTEPPETPSLISPIGGVWLHDATVTLRWTAVTKLAGGVKSRPIRYFVELMSNDSTVLVDTVDTNQLTVSLSEGRYNWHVRASDLVGNLSDWSPIDSFGVDITPPTSVTLLEPQDGEILSSSHVFFEWTDAEDTTSGIAGYWLEMADNSDFSSPESLFVSPSYIILTVHDTICFWRVKAVDSSGLTGAWSEVWNFEVDTVAPEMPSLVSPVGGVWLHNTNVTLRWTSSSKGSEEAVDNNVKGSSVHYVIEVTKGATTVIFDTIEVDTFSTILQEGVYRWHVKAFDDAGNQSDWSPTDSFGVDITPPTAVTLLWPPDGEFFNDPSVSFYWDDAEDTTSGVAGYWLEIASNNDFSSPESVFVSQSETTLTVHDTICFWRVKAVDGSGLTGAWSETRSFEVDTVAPEMPSLVSPVGGVWLHDTTVTFRWSQSSKGLYHGIKSSPDHYQIEIRKGDITVIFRTVDTDTISLVLQEGVYRWRVVAFDDAGNQSDWTPFDSFGVDITPPTAVTLLTPQDGALFNSSSVSFDWTDAEDTTSGVAGYWLEIAGNNDFSSPESVFVSQSETTLTVHDTICFWRVKAVDGAGLTGAWSEVWSFEVDTVAPEMPSLVSPVGGVWLHDTSVTFEWTSAAKSMSVRYIFELMYYGISIIVDTVDTNELTVSINEGRYYWRVKAFDMAGNQSDWSQIDSFGIDMTPPDTVSLIAPTNGAKLNTSSVTFNWNGSSDLISGVMGYWIELSNDSLFATPESVFVSHQINYYLPETTITLSDTTWFWRVKAVDSSGLSSAWSETWMFTVDTQAPLVSSLIDPMSGVWLHDTTVTFRWSQSSKQWSGPLKGKETSIHYVIEVLKGNTILISDTVDTNELTTIIYEGRYTWHVKAFDEAGNASDWSPIDSFGVDITPPGVVELILPPDDAVLNHPDVTFDWSDAEDTTSGIAGYWLELSTDSLFNYADSIFVSQSETTMTLNDTTWFWRVKAVDVSGLSGEWSYKFLFTIDTNAPQAPVAISPVGGEWLHDTYVTFQWTEVSKKPMIMRYVIEVMRDGDVVLHDTTDVNAYTAVLSEGRYIWHVKAFDEAGNASDWSPIDSFGVDITPPGVVELILPPDDAVLNHPDVTFDWSDAEDTTSGVAGYWLEVGVDSEFIIADSAFITQSETTVVLPDTTFFWRVRAIDGSGLQGDWSDIRRFTIDSRAPDVPSLYNPTGGIWLRDTIVDFNWSSVESPSKPTPVHYVIEVISGGATVIHDTVDTNELVVVLDEGRYTWHVKAFDEAGNASDWSPIDSFGVDITPPTPPEPIWPIDSFATSVDTIEFVWHPALDNLSGVQDYLLNFANDAWVTTDTFVTVEIGHLMDGIYTWYVSATDTAENTSISDEQVFIIDRTAPNIEELTTWSDTIGFFGPFEIQLRVTDSLSGVGEAWLFYSVDGGDFDSIPMTHDSLWHAQIPAFSDSMNHTISYFVRAFDNAVPPNECISETITFNVTGIEEEPHILPSGFALLGVTPNPTGNFVMFKLAVPHSGSAHLELFDASGRRILSRDFVLEPGYRIVKVNLSSVTSGIYYAIIIYGNVSVKGRIIVVR